MQAELADSRAQSEAQFSAVEKLNKLTSSLQQKQDEASSKIANEKSRQIIARLESQNASFQAQLSEQKSVVEQQSARSSSEQRTESRRVSQEGSIDSGARSPENLAGTQQLRKEASDLEKENFLLRKQLSLLEGSGADSRLKSSSEQRFITMLTCTAQVLGCSARKGSSRNERLLGIA